MLKYTKDHEWLRIDGDVGDRRHHAVCAGKARRPRVRRVAERRREVRQGRRRRTVESVKAASDVYAPVGGEVVAVNDKVTASPAWSIPSRPAMAGCSR